MQLILDLAGNFYFHHIVHGGIIGNFLQDYVILGEISIPYFVEVGFIALCIFQKECFTALKIIEIEFVLQLKQQNYEQPSPAYMISRELPLL